MAAELGVEHAWLPVTHTVAPHEYGLWFYYARGCSDMLWNVGRTILARNRCHAALILESMFRGVSQREAVQYLDSFRLQEDSATHLVKYRAITWLGMRNASLSDLIAECGRGLFGDCSGDTWNADGTLRPCRCLPADAQGPPRAWRVGSRRRAMTLSFLAGSSRMDGRLGRLLHNLSFDTLQLWQQLLR